MLDKVNGEIVKPIYKNSRYVVSESGRVYNKELGYRELTQGVVESSAGIKHVYVQIVFHGMVLTKTVHRLVHRVFNKSKKRPYHKDGNCLNNHYTNLTDNKPPYKLEKGEEWIKGYEGRYFMCKGKVYSVLRDIPKKLKSTSYDGKEKYQLYSEDGKMVSFYF